MPALQSGCYDITWERYADLPSPMYNTSAVQHDKKVYIMAGTAPDIDTHYQVYYYSIMGDQWGLLPPHKHIQGRLQVISGHLTIIGGWDENANMATNNVSTLINNSWTNHYPNLLRARCKPGVVSHSEYVIVAGGAKDKNNFYDNIEILKTTYPSQWMMTSTVLPEPMWGIFPTISDNNILIVGYYKADGKVTNTSYQLPVDIITSSAMSAPNTDQPVQWMELPSAPHYNTITIPNTHPPVILGGSIQGVPTSDIAMLDESSEEWIEVSSLSSPRNCIAVVPIDNETILILGGCTGGQSVAGAKAHSTTTVEKGRAILIQTAAAIPTEDAQCSIQ